MRYANPGYIATRKVDWRGDTNRPFHNLHAGFQIPEAHDRGVRGVYFDRHRAVRDNQTSASGGARCARETGFQSLALSGCKCRAGVVLFRHVLHFVIRICQLYEFMGPLAPI